MFINSYFAAQAGRPRVCVETATPCAGRPLRLLVALPAVLFLRFTGYNTLGSESFAARRNQPNGPQHFKPNPQYSKFRNQVQEHPDRTGAVASLVFPRKVNAPGNIRSKETRQLTEGDYSGHLRDYRDSVKWESS